MRIWWLLCLLGCSVDKLDGAPVNLAIERDGCYIAGCSLQVCSADPGAVFTTCEDVASYVCYRAYFAICEPQPSGACGWTQSDELRACLEDHRT
jgi:hypothetical protein